MNTISIADWDFAGVGQFHTSQLQLNLRNRERARERKPRFQFTNADNVLVLSMDHGQERNFALTHDFWAPDEGVNDHSCVVVDHAGNKTWRLKTDKAGILFVALGQEEDLV